MQKYQYIFWPTNTVTLHNINMATKNTALYLTFDFLGTFHKIYSHLKGLEHEREHVYVFISPPIGRYAYMGLPHRNIETAE